MKLFSKTSVERNYQRIFLVVFVAAVVLRVAVVLLFTPTGADGPTRLMKAYAWQSTPSFVTHGEWLPGFTYLVGTVSFFFKDPGISGRLVNLVLGSFSILVFYLLIRKVYDPTTALISASMLAVFPLHVGLSTGGLTEATFAFEIIAGIFFFLTASESESAKRRFLYLILSLFFLCLGVMTRREAWVLIPVFPLYYFLKRRKIFESLLIAVVLLIFPFIWTLNNYFYTHNPFRGFIGSGAWHHGLKFVSLFSAVVVILRQSVFHLGFVVPFLAAAGLAFFFFQAAKRAIDSKRIFYIAITGVYWAGVVAYTMVRPETIWDRFLLFPFIMTLPLAALPLSYYYGRHKQQLFAVILLAVILVVSVVYKPGAYNRYLNTWHSRFYVTLLKPTEMMHIFSWIESSPYSESPILLTKINKQAVYFSVYFPEHRQRLFIVKDAKRDIKLERFLESQKPSLLITCDDDSEVLTRIEVILGTKIGADRLIHAESYIKIYDIRSAVDAKQF